MSDSQVCWDVPNWYDSTGDGCLWYQTKDNGCSLFGSQFPNTDGLTANDACCGCGGGLSLRPLRQAKKLLILLAAQMTPSTGSMKKDLVVIGIRTKIGIVLSLAVMSALKG